MFASYPSLPPLQYVGGPQTNYGAPSVLPSGYSQLQQLATDLIGLRDRTI